MSRLNFLLLFTIIGMILLAIGVLFNTSVYNNNNYIPSDSLENWDSLIYVTKHYDTVYFKWLKSKDYDMIFYIDDVKQKP